MDFSILFRSNHLLEKNYSAMFFSVLDLNLDFYCRKSDWERRE